MQTYEYTDIDIVKNKDFCNCISRCCNDEDKTAFLDGLFSYLKKLKLDKVLIRGHNRISTQNFVGTIKYKRFQLDILPKLLKKNNDTDYSTVLHSLIFMLSYTKKLDITTNSGKLSESKNPFLEILIREFAQSLYDCLKRITPKRYVNEENNLNYLKGKLKFNENIKYNSANEARFYCQFDEFSENNILNQLFLYVATCLYSISRDSKNKKILKLIIDYFCDIKFVHFNRYNIQKIRLSKNQQMFAKPFSLAKMFIEKSSVDISKNSIQNITLLWDMNILFEEFIYEVLKRNTKLNPVYQKGKRLLIETDSNKKYGNTFADMYVEQDNNKIIIDTKYKINSGENNDFKNEDIYQLMTYCLIHNSKKAVFVYPAEFTQDTTRYFLNTDKVDKLCKYKDEKIENIEEIYNNANKIISIQVDLKQELNRNTVNTIANYIEEQILSEKTFS